MNVDSRIRAPSPRRRRRREEAGMSNQHQTVLEVRHWTDRLFSFTATRDSAFRFQEQPSSP